MDSSVTLPRGSSSPSGAPRLAGPAAGKVVAILGAGPTGLGAAHYLTLPAPLEGLSTHLFEAQPQAGGFHQSIEIDGHWVDTGSFFYPIRTGTGYSFVNIIPDTFKPVDNLRLGVYFNGRYNRFPLPWKFVLQSLKPADRYLMGPGLLWNRFLRALPGKKPFSLEYWFETRMTRPVYKASGMEIHSSKLMGLHPSQLDEMMGKKRLQRIDKLESLRFAYQLFKKAKARGKMAGGGGDAKWSDIFYPVSGGAGALPRRMLELLDERGVQVHLGTRVTRLTREGDKVWIDYESGGVAGRLLCDAVISTLPIHVLAKLNGMSEEYRALRYRTLIMIYLVVSKPDAMRSMAQFYSFEPHHHWKRITNFTELRHTELGKSESALGAEITLDENVVVSESDMAMYVENLVASLTDEMKLFERSDIKHVVTRTLRDSYPIPDLQHRDRLAQFQNELEGSPILSVGRFGNFDYVNTPTCLQYADEAARYVKAQLGYPVA